MSLNEQNLIWIDLEMTGLAPEANRILEISTIVTDIHLNILAYGPDVAIHQPESVLKSMDAWCTEQHTQSGLLDRVRASNLTEAQAEQMTIEALLAHVPAGKSPMCGNSICLDRRFLYLYMPRLEKFFHYRHIDVSTLKELALRWAPQMMTTVEKKSRHRAKDDIIESIEELKYYKNNFISLSLP